MHDDGDAVQVVTSAAEQQAMILPEVRDPRMITRASAALFARSGEAGALLTPSHDVPSRW